MSVPSVLFDAPGPKARRLSLVSSIVLASSSSADSPGSRSPSLHPARAAASTLPGYFDPSRWDIFADPEVWERIIVVGVVGTLRRRSSASVFAIVLGVILSLLRSSDDRVDQHRPTAVVLEFVRGMPVLLMMLFILLVLNTGAYLGGRGGALALQRRAHRRGSPRRTRGAAEGPARGRTESRHAAAAVEDARRVPAGVPADAPDHRRPARGAPEGHLARLHRRIHRVAAVDT